MYICLPLYLPLPTPYTNSPLFIYLYITTYIFIPLYTYLSLSIHISLIRVYSYLYIIIYLFLTLVLLYISLYHPVNNNLKQCANNSQCSVRTNNLLFGSVFLAQHNLLYHAITGKIYREECTPLYIFSRISISHSLPPIPTMSIHYIQLYNTLCL